jgi:hypothetical protein
MAAVKMTHPVFQPANVRAEDVEIWKAQGWVIADKKEAKE